MSAWLRNTVDVDLLIRPEDSEKFKSALLTNGFAWSQAAKEFRLGSGMSVKMFLAGEREGLRQSAKFPDPGNAKYVKPIEGLPVLKLSQLIQAKLACGLSNLRRTYKDFADVVELIAIHRLNGSFARYLHKSVRGDFRELVHRAGGRSK